jgi:hypothetical protein
VNVNPPRPLHLEDMTGTLDRVGVVQRFHQNVSRRRKIIVRLRGSLTCLVLQKAKLPELINHARINVPCRFVRDN